jgi:hypothetical protein
MEFEDKEATQEKINIIMRQTNYEEGEARSKLIENNNDHITVIKKYLGIVDKKEKKMTSVNQEIYRQLRHKMDDSVRAYNKKQKEKLANEISTNNTDPI